MEIYAAFPLLLWLLRVTRRHHGLLLAVSLAVQTAFTGTLHYFRDAAPHAPGLLGAWMRNPDPVVFSYQLYLVAGGIAALHLEELAAWVRDHGRTVRLLVAGGLAAGMASYVFDHVAGGMDAAAAGEVFQPMMAVTTAASVLGLFALGVRWADRGPQRRLRRVVRAGSDATFGVYLAHPLLLQGLLVLAARLPPERWPARSRPASCCRWISWWSSRCSWPPPWPPWPGPGARRRASWSRAGRRSGAGQMQREHPVSGAAGSCSLPLGRIQLKPS